MMYAAFGVVAFVLLTAILHLGWTIGAWHQRKRDEIAYGEKRSKEWEDWLRGGRKRHRQRLIERARHAQENDNAN